VPPDPVDPEEWWLKIMKRKGVPANESAEYWARIRSDEGRPFAAWTVRLSCGHINDTTFIDDIDWRPEHGHKPNPEEAERRRGWLKKGKDPEWLRLECEARLADGWLEPQNVQHCHACVWNRRIVSCKPIGRLTWKGDDAHPSGSRAIRFCPYPAKPRDRAMASDGELVTRAR
jgi:hypothetical protein